MYKYNIKYFIVLFLFALCIGYGVPALAQEGAPKPTTSSPETPACPPVVWMCPEVASLNPESDGMVGYRIIGRGLPTNPDGTKIQVYVVSGIQTPDNYYLTTGKSSTDETYCLGKDTLASMRDKFGYYFQSRSAQNPITPNEYGEIDMHMMPITTLIQSHAFFLMWESTVDVTGGNNEGQQARSGGTSGLEYEDFVFTSAPAQCASFRSDPFGRVFNEQLRPVPGSIVSLYDNATQALYKLPGVPNPVTTQEDGVFNFNIEPGTTFLKTNLVNNPLNVHQNASLAYSNIYTYGDPIVETAGKIEQRDIPVTGGGIPVLKLMNYGHLQFGSEVKIEGNASWPLTIVDIMQGKVSLAQKQSTKFGRFTFFIPSESIDPAQQITIKLTEVDLLNDPNVPKVGGVEVEKTFDPIPSYVEGYAYDKTGTLMPNAIVRVKLVQSDQVYYQTNADTNAYFVVKKQYLPIIPFYLEYTPQNATPSETVSRKVTIPEYAEENTEYLEREKIDIMRGSIDGVPIKPDTTSRDGIKEGGDNGSDSLDMNEKTRREAEAKKIAEEAEKQSRQQQFITLIILIICFVAIGIGIVIFLKKRKGLVERPTEGGDRAEDLKEEDLEE